MGMPTPSGLASLLTPKNNFVRFVVVVVGGGGVQTYLTPLVSESFPQRGSSSL